MPFTDDLLNQTQTDKGALAYKSTKSTVLDLFTMGISTEEKEPLITAALKEDPLLAIKVALYLRDVRNGQGNRDILRALFRVLNQHKMKRVMKHIADHIPEIGRWKDLVELLTLHPKLDKRILKLIEKNWQTDALLAKWLPRQGIKAKLIAKHLQMDHGVYRRSIVHLSKTVEQQMCTKMWSEINYSQVPSIANKKYAKAFLRNDANRRTQFLQKAVTGKVKMNSSVLYPHQITYMIDTNWLGDVKNNPTADALWANLPSYMENAQNVLPIIDVSGSMWSPAIGTEGDCIDVALGLGLYFAEHNTGTYKDVWMNFSTNPQSQLLVGNTISERISNMNFRNWGMTTDLNKAMEFVLAAAKKNPEDMPKMLLIISDMQFDRAGGTTNLDHTKKLFKQAGLKMPLVVFWRVNVSANQNTPATCDEANAIIINGYSPSILKYILSGDITSYTPYKAMREVIDPMYEWLGDIKD